MADKRVIVPSVDMRHDDVDMGYVINVDLAGAPKKTVSLDIGKAGFCVKAEADDFCYESCFTLNHEVKAEEATAKFKAGLLTICVPFIDNLRGTKVTIE